MAKEEKERELKKIRDEVFNLKNSPLYDYRTKNKFYPVVGEGNHSAKIILIGEAPGKNEALTGRPFCGAAGKFLDQLLQSVNLNRSETYITNIVKDRPPENRDPLPEEIALYAPFLDRQINAIQPKIIVALGRFSMKYLMEKFGLSDKIDLISRLHGQAFEVNTPYGKINIFISYHPAAALYDGSAREVLLKDFKNLESLIKAKN
ncbi:uracil-DNA glycosylase [Patescibacteria group bacterium]|nr:uracil-DNA glycosylase [Patescibacteria group bacterium]